MISQFFDTIIVNSIFLGFGLGLPWEVGRQDNRRRVSFLKSGMAALDTPFIYLGVAVLRRYIGADAVEEAAAEVL